MEKPAKARPRSGSPQAQSLLSRLGKLPANLLQIGAGVAELGAQNLRLKPATSSLPFAATRTLFNNTATSSERRYGSCEIPLARVKALASATGTTVNDIVHDPDRSRPARIPRRAQGRDRETAGGAHGHVGARRGPGSRRQPGRRGAGGHGQTRRQPGRAPAADPRVDRPDQGTAAQSCPVAVRQLYAMVLFGSTTLPDIVAAFKSMPSINLVISNMRGPQGQRYLAGAPLVAFQGCPIVPPGAGLNVSFVSVNDMICLGVGATPEAVADPYRLTRLILSALEELEKIALPKTRCPQRRR